MQCEYKYAALVFKVLYITYAVHVGPYPHFVVALKKLYMYHEQNLYCIRNNFF